MNGRQIRSTSGFTVVAVTLAVAGVLLVYYGQMDTGLYYDDYHFVRPLSHLELRRVWFGSWDPTGLESPFFRPVTAWLFALRFWAFGLNTEALHAISIGGHVICAALVGWFLRRADVPDGVSLLGVWLYAIHPLFPYAQVSWLTNQMHLAESLTVMLALLVWQGVRDRPLSWFAALLLPLAATAFLIKEDAVMLLPLILALTILRAWLVQPSLRQRVRTLLPLVMVAVVALVTFRQQRLGRLGGYGLPGVDQAQTQFWKGLDAALLLWPTRTPWQAVASLIAIAVVCVVFARGKWKHHRIVVLMLAAAVLALSSKLPALFYDISYPLVTPQGIASGLVTATVLTGAGLAAGRRLSRPLIIMCTGLAITLAFNLPFVMVSKREQYHLIAFGAVVLLAGMADALQMASEKVARYVLVLGIVASMPLALLARTQAADFRPCAPGVLQADADVSGWWVVPTEIRAWFPEKRQRCEAGLAPKGIRELPVVSWGLHGEERGTDGAPFRWTGDRVVLLSRRDRSSVAFAVRSPDASATAPVLVTVDGGRRPAQVLLDSNLWTYVTVRPAGGILAWMRAAHRVDVVVAPWFVPAVRDPKQTDLRRYGVQFRFVEDRRE